MAPIRLLELAQRADVVFVGRDDAQALWGTETADDVVRLLAGVSVVVVKDADVGATEHSSDGTVFVPAPVVKVVEPIGAGDVFAAGYLTALLRGAMAAERLESGHRFAELALGTPDDVVIDHVSKIILNAPPRDRNQT